MNYYEILNVDRTATKTEIKRAYHSLAKIHHPDKGGEAEKMRQLIEAYEILRDDESKNEYDAKLNSCETSTHGSTTINKYGVKTTVDYEVTFSERAKRSLKIYKENIAKSDNPKFHRNKEEQQARIDFAVRHKYYLDKQNEKIHNFEMWLFDTPIDKRIELCKSSIRELLILKEYCLKNGGKIYYADMFEHCHNSKTECFSWEERLNDLLDFLYRVKHLSEEIQEILIKEAQIRQIDLMRCFPTDFKPYVMREIDSLLAKNIIEKTKVKNAYVITLKN